MKIAVITHYLIFRRGEIAPFPTPHTSEPHFNRTEDKQFCRFEHQKQTNDPNLAES